MSARLPVPRTTAGHGPRHDERGGILIMVALSLLVMIGLAAVVVDIGFLRWDKRASQSAADMASVAGALSLPPGGQGSGLVACQMAWDYFLENSNSESSDDPCSSPVIGDFTEPCVVDPDVPATPTENVAQGTVGDYVVTITWPVRDDNAELLQGRSDLADGDECERISVEVERGRGYVLAGVFDQSGGFTTAPSVARMALGEDTVVPALIVLDENDCGALHTSGQGGIHVRAADALDDDGNPIPGQHSPGIIATDSDGTGSCPNPPYSYIMETGGTIQGRILAGIDEDGTFRSGEIWSYALEAGDAQFAYNPANVTQERLFPRPTPNMRVTRAPMDHRYNCFVGNQHLLPDDTRFPEEYPGCATNDDGVEIGGDYIRGLDSRVLGQEQERFTDYVSVNYPHIGNPCQNQDNDADLVLDLQEGTLTNSDATAWRIDCPSQLRVADSIVITGGDVIFDGTVNLGSHGELYIGYTDSDVGDSEDPEGTAAVADQDEIIVYVKSGGNLQKGAQATLAFHHTFVYLHGGILDIGGGQNGVLQWTAPGAWLDGSSDDLDAAYDFFALALWSESTSTHSFTGQGHLILEGIFFTPNARVEFKGQSEQTNEARAQFWSDRLLNSGKATMVMNPDPAFAMDIPRVGANLIR